MRHRWTRKRRIEAFWKKIRKTIRDNNQDAVQKGRNARAETHGFAKQTWAEVRTIRWLASLGYRQARLAEWFGLSSPQISGIVSGRYWKDGA